MTERLIKSLIAEELFGSRICESMDQTDLVNFIHSELIFPEEIFEKLLIGEPITVPELRDILHRKIVDFEFIKLDGNVRPAQGTTVMKYIPGQDQPTGLNPSSDKVAAFWDLNKDAWRSVSNRSKEIVLQKDDETGKPKVVVSDKKPKEEPVKQEFDQGKTYDFTTKNGFDTEVEVIRELPNGLYQVKSEEFKNSFAIDPARLGNEVIPTDKEPEPRPVPPPIQPVVKPTIRPKAPLPIPTEPEEIPPPPVEEEPLDLTDPTQMADDIEDKDIVAPGIERRAKPDDDLGLEPKIVPAEEPLPPEDEITFKDEPDDEDTDEPGMSDEGKPFGV